MSFLYKITLLLSVLIVSGCLEKQEDPNTPKTIIVSDAYSFATMPGSSTGAAFMIIKNAGTEDDRLTGVKARFAGISEIHENVIDPDDNTMMMRKIKDIVIPAGGEAVLEPAGKHLMFLKLKDTLTLGHKTPITLIFEKAGEQQVEIHILQPGSSPHQGH